jgi:hypothetical protein
MIHLTITSDDPQNDKQDLDDFCYQNNYQDYVNGLPNAQTKLQFANQVIIQFIKDAVIKGRSARIPTSVNIQ